MTAALAQIAGLTARVDAVVTTIKKVESFIHLFLDAMFFANVATDIYRLATTGEGLLAEIDRGIYEFEAKKETPVFTKVGYRFFVDGEHDKWLAVAMDFRKQGEDKRFTRKATISANISKGEIRVSSGFNLELFKTSLFKFELALLRAGRG